VNPACASPTGVRETTYSKKEKGKGGGELGTNEILQKRNKKKREKTPKYPRYEKKIHKSRHRRNSPLCTVCCSDK